MSAIEGYLTSFAAALAWTKSPVLTLALSTSPCSLPAPRSTRISPSRVGRPACQSSPVPSEWLRSRPLQAQLSFGRCVRRWGRGAVCSSRLGNRPAGLTLVRVVAVAGRDVGEQHAPAAVLPLPDVAELVSDQIVGGSRARWPAEENCAPQGIAAVPPHPRQPEEERRDEDAHSLDANRAWIQGEPIQPRLGPPQRRASLGTQRASGARMRIALPSCACWNS
jgi:hypothetical protein